MSLNWSVKKVKDHALICFENVYRGDGQLVERLGR